MQANISIEPVTKKILALPLLLKADPSRESVLQYLQKGDCYAAMQESKILGAYVIQRTRPFMMELMNLVVKEEFRGMGVGRMLVDDAIAKARQSGAKTLEVGTGNSSLSSLALYQKCGFRIRSVETDYFRRHYNEAIIENGIECTDMIRLSLDLQSNLQLLSGTEA